MRLAFAKKQNFALPKQNSLPKAFKF